MLYIHQSPQNAPIGCQFAHVELNARIQRVTINIPSLMSFVEGVGLPELS